MSCIALVRFTNNVQIILAQINNRCFNYVIELGFFINRLFAKSLGRIKRDCYLKQLLWATKNVIQKEITIILILLLNDDVSLIFELFNKAKKEQWLIMKKQTWLWIQKWLSYQIGSECIWGCCFKFVLSVSEVEC